jgi:hypothetical protein
MTRNPFKPMPATQDLCGSVDNQSIHATVGLPAAPASLPLTQICRIVRQVVAEMVMLTGDRVQMRRDRRRAVCHIRQIAMYVCHVTLSIPLTDIGQAFGRDRTTVGHACSVVEDRRDNTAYDEFLSIIERLIATIFGRSEAPIHE